jgi:hypothetical protein
MNNFGFAALEIRKTGLKKNKQPNAPEQKKMGKIGNRPLWVLYMSVGIRAVHQVGCAILLAAALLPGTVSNSLYTTLAFGSGAVLLVTEAMRHRQFYREFAGLITLFKLLLLGAAFHGFLPLSSTVLLIFIMASIGSHTPKQIRHRLLF